jgi:hypothetical protein
LNYNDYTALAGEGLSQIVAPGTECITVALRGRRPIGKEKAQGASRRPTPLSSY